MCMPDRTTDTTILDDLLAIEELHERHLELMQEPKCVLCGPQGKCWHHRVDWNVKRTPRDVQAS